MALSGTFTLNAEYVIVETIEQTIVVPIGNAAIGEIIQLGSSVTDWSVADTILYNNSDAALFKNNDDTWAVISQNNIYFKYEAEAEP